MQAIDAGDTAKLAEIPCSERRDAECLRHSEAVLAEQARHEAERSNCRTVEFPWSGEYSLDEVDEYFSRFGSIENIDWEPPSKNGDGLIGITYPDVRAASEAVVSPKPLINSYGIHHLRIRLKK